MASDTYKSSIERQGQIDPKSSLTSLSKRAISLFPERSQLTAISPKAKRKTPNVLVWSLHMFTFMYHIHNT